MADDADRASEVIEAHRQKAIDTARRALAASIGDNPTGICIDCGDDIPAGRLKAIPGALRCAPCQGDHARRG